ncbi:MAG TPA: hypothetical protein VFK47_08400 [Ktedonobacteraceae bacterium]|nr:hypothetical protein [Ktedonobacteraceae bacterium]
MPSIKFSAPSSAPAATSITVALGGSPAVGDLVLVFLLVDNEIVTHQPGWASEFTANPNPWFPLEGLRSVDTSTLTGWYHTWNASDSGNSATFTFVPAPTLGIGDKDVSSTNALAIAVVLDGANSSAVLEHNIYGTTERAVTNFRSSNGMKLPGGLTFHAVCATGSTASWSDNDGSASLVQGVTLATAAGMTLAVFQRVASPAGYRPMFTTGSPLFSMVQAVSVSDNQPQLYNGPFIEEAPMAHNPLMNRYRMNRYFTVLNNSGIFSAQRYQSTDQIAAATQVFVNNQPITSTDRTNLLASGVGGDFQAVT